MEEFYITGDPKKNSEASLVIAFEKHPDIVTRKKDPNYDIDKDEYII